MTTVIVRPTTTPTQGGGGASCGDNPIACVGKSPLAVDVNRENLTLTLTGASCRTNQDCGFDLILCKSGVCSL